jgi:hypothetical protein
MNIGDCGGVDESRTTASPGAVPDWRSDPIAVAVDAVDRGIALFDEIDASAPDAMGLTFLAGLVERQVNRLRLVAA